MSSPLANREAVIHELTRVRQVRHYRSDPVPPELLHELLDVARWSGSAQNSQPWHFLVIDDPALKAAIVEIQPSIDWMLDAPVVISIVLNGRRPKGEMFDEGRVIERMMITARLLGLRSAVAWFGDASQQAAAKSLLGIPAEKTARSIVVVGYPAETPKSESNPERGGRKPLEELVRYNRYGSDDLSSPDRTG